MKGLPCKTYPSTVSEWAFATIESQPQRLLWNTLQKKMSKNSSIESNPPKPEIFTTLALPTGRQNNLLWWCFHCIWNHACNLEGQCLRFYKNPLHICFGPCYPVRAHFYGLLFLTSIHCHVTFPPFFHAFLLRVRLVHVGIAHCACHTKPLSCWIDNVRVQSATEWTASEHTLHMPKPVITFVFKVLRNGLLRYILYTRPNLW